MEYEINDKLELVAGTEYRHSHIQGQYLVSEKEIPEETGNPEVLDGGNHFFSKDFGIFSQLNYQPFNRLFLVLGGRFDNNVIRKTGGYGTVFNPKIAAIYSPNNIVIKAIYSEALKDAEFWTKYGTTPGRLLNNPSLPPEKVKNIDLSAGWKISSNAYFDIAGFYAFYDGVVGTADVTFIDDEGNTINTTQHQAIGQIEISGAQSIINWKMGNYSAFFNYTYTNPFNTTENQKVRIGDIASHQVNMGGAYNLRNNTTFSIRCNWVGERKTGKTTTISSNPYDIIEPHLVVDGSINQKIWKGISAQISAFNLLNTEYFHPGVRSANGIYYAAKIPQYERHFFVQLMLEL
jgi:outer membrane receptor for ferrienterochelin and colicin